MIELSSRKIEKKNTAGIDIIPGKISLDIVFALINIGILFCIGNSIELDVNLLPNMYAHHLRSRFLKRPQKFENWLNIGLGFRD